MLNLQELHFTPTQGVTLGLWRIQGQGKEANRILKVLLGKV